MQKYYYILFIIFWVFIGIIFSVYDDYLMQRDLKHVISIDYSTPIQVKKRFVRLYRDGRTKLLNDSLFAFSISSFDGTFWLDDNWGKVDSLIKRANSDSLRCVLINGDVIYLETRDPAKDNGW